jgi:myo-inositol-1-phosphate synthase
MHEIRIGIVGVGNCASSLVQGIEYYGGKNRGEIASGLMHHDICGYKAEDIKVVAAFDIDKRKVGRPLSDAVFADPNCTKTIGPVTRASDVIVSMGNPLDGIYEHMSDFPENRRFAPAAATPEDVAKILREREVEVLVNYLPVGSEEATRYYARCCLDAGVSLVNCIPVFIASDAKWVAMFEEKGIPLAGDDVKSQLGATIIHRTLAKLFNDRGVTIDRTYQLNTGGNTDFLNMLNRDRLISKKISKTEAVQSQLDVPLNPENIHVGPSDYVPWQHDNKVCFLRIEGRIFGDIPIDLELRLSVEDSPNSAGCVIDTIRCCKVARDRKVGGVLESISGYTMKHPIKQFSDEEARRMVEEFIRGERIR